MTSRSLGQAMAPVTIALSAAFILSLMVADPARAGLAYGTLVRDDCSSIVSQSGVTTYDDGTPTERWEEGPAKQTRIVSLEVRRTKRSTRLDLAFEGGNTPGDRITHSIVAARDRGPVGTSLSTTAEGLTRFAVRLRLGQRTIELGSFTPRWTGDGRKNSAAGPWGIGIYWHLSINLRKYIGQIRRHEAKGGKTVVAFKYLFPETTLVRGFDGSDYSYRETTLWTGVECGARSRPLTLARR